MSALSSPILSIHDRLTLCSLFLSHPCMSLSLCLSASACICVLFL